MNGPLAGLDPTEAELRELDAVLAEIDAGDLEDLDGYDGLGDDEAALAAEMDAAMAELATADYDLDQMAQINGALELSATLDMQRQAEDAAEMPADTEDRTAHLLGRIERGTYLPLQAAYDDTLGNCGPRDDLGYCTARFHDAGCMSVLTAEAANGSAESALAWRQQLLSNQGAATAVHLANERLAAQDAAQAASGVRSSAAYREMRGLLGLGR